MANDVFANGREIACKAGAGKTICAFPDVCFTPPENPATPPGVPVPYPNTGFASDTTKGSKNVKISDKEIMLKNKSCFKKSTGDEAGCAAKKGVVTSTNTGEVYFQAWSMNVKVEGQNVDRHFDLTTNNHASLPGDTPPWVFTDSMTPAQIKDCEEDKKKEEEACSEDGISRGKKTKYKSTKECCDDDRCQKTRKCMLVPYKNKSKKTCCPGQTGHHLVEVHCFCVKGIRGKPLPEFMPDPSLKKKAYNLKDAPCVCAKCPRGSRWVQEHGDLHAVQGMRENSSILKAKYNKNKKEDYAWTYSESRDAGVDAHSATFPNSECNPDCIAAQLDQYHKGVVKVDDDTPLRTTMNKFKKDPDQFQRGRTLLLKLARRIGTRLKGLGSS